VRAHDALIHQQGSGAMYRRWLIAMGAIWVLSWVVTFGTAMDMF
jgi:hypothetical protein